MKNKFLAACLLTLPIVNPLAVLAIPKLEQNQQERKAMIEQNTVEAKPVPNKVNEPADLIDLVPVLRDIKRMIPKQFSIADHTCRVSANQVVIEHRYEDKKISMVGTKNSIVSLSYSGALASDLSTLVHVPLAYKSGDGIIMDGWARYPAGNYTITINRSVALMNQIFLKAETRF